MSIEGTRTTPPAPSQEQGRHRFPKPTPTPPPMALDSRRRRGRCGEGWCHRLEVPPFFPARQTFTGGIEAVLPVWLAANLDEDIGTHEVGYGISKATLMIQDG